MGEQINSDEEIDGLLAREPFVPFSIVLTSGDRYGVTSPRQVAIGGNTVVVMRPRRGISFFRKSQMVAVDVPETSS